jgi:hypothetical protein
MTVLRRLRLSPAMVVACLALLLALGGTAYAQFKLPRNSVTSIHVKDRSLLGKDFRQGQIPAGKPGPAGPAGPAGAAGPAGPAGPAGAAGSAKAFARVAQSGDVDDPRAKAIADAAVSKPATGVYCIDIDGGALNVVGTLDVAGGAGMITASLQLTGCPSGKEVEVRTFDDFGAPIDHAFFVSVN